MPPKQRKSFYLAFSKNPSASDVVRNDNIISYEPFKFRYEKTVGKGDWVEAEGEIKDQGNIGLWQFSLKHFGNSNFNCPLIKYCLFIVGYKKDLEKIKLDCDGNPCSPDDPRKVGTRKQELEKLRMAQVNAQRNHLQQVAEEILDGGAGEKRKPLK